MITLQNEFKVDRSAIKLPKLPNMISLFRGKYDADDIKAAINKSRYSDTVFTFQALPDLFVISGDILQHKSDALDCADDKVISLDDLIAKDIVYRY